MQFKTKKDAIASINERKRIVNGTEYPLYEVYLGRNLITGKPERLYSSEKSKLITLIEEFYRARSRSGDFSTVLTPEQIIDARAALGALAETRMNISLLECVKREIDRAGRVAEYGKTLGDAYDEFIKSKSLNSHHEIKKTNSTSGRWVDSMGRDRLASSVTIEDISQYLKTFFGDNPPKTYNSHLNYIKTFLSWCAGPEQKIIPENPALPMKPKPIAWKRPKYLKPDEVQKVFDILWPERFDHPEYLALAVTQFFVGVRREEAIRIAQNPDTATIIIEDETFRVDGGKGYTNGKAPRAAHLSENAVAWMKSFDYMRGIQLVTENTTAYYYNLVREKGVGVFKNCARHTFITMHVAKFHAPEVTQSMVGTSGTMRAVHYDGLASQKEGEAYFGIFPPTSASPCSQSSSAV